MTAIDLSACLSSLISDFSLAVREHRIDRDVALILADALADAGRHEDAIGVRWLAEGTTPGGRPLRLASDGTVREYAIVTHQRGTWEHQDAYSVALYAPHRTRKGGWVWKSEDHVVAKASMPQLNRAGWGGRVRKGSRHHRPMCAGAVAAMNFLSTLTSEEDA